MKYLLLLLLVACCGGGTSFYEKFPQPTESPRVVKVQCVSGWGTGFPVAREGRFTVLATAKHVTDGCELPDGWVLWREHKYADVSLVLTPLKLEPFKLGVPRMGTAVASYGYPGAPGDGSLQVTKGHISGRTAGGLVRLTAPLWFGFSGGPVFNDAGEVVCMNTAIYQLLDGWSLCTETEYVTELLEQ